MQKWHAATHLITRWGGEGKTRAEVHWLSQLPFIWKTIACVSTLNSKLFSQEHDPYTKHTIHFSLSKNAEVIPWKYYIICYRFLSLHALLWVGQYVPLSVFVTGFPGRHEKLFSGFDMNTDRNTPGTKHRTQRQWAETYRQEGRDKRTPLFSQLG